MSRVIRVPRLSLACVKLAHVLFIDNCLRMKLRSWIHSKQTVQHSWSQYHKLASKVRRRSKAWGCGVCRGSGWQPPFLNKTCQWALRTWSGLSISSMDSILSSFYLTLLHSVDNFSSRGAWDIPREELQIHLAWALMLDIYSICPELHWLMGVSIRWYWARCVPTGWKYSPWDIICTEVWSSS